MFWQQVNTKVSPQQMERGKLAGRLKDDVSPAHTLCLFHKKWRRKKEKKGWTDKEETGDDKVNYRWRDKDNKR